MVQDGAKVSAERLAVVANQEISVFVAGAGSELTAQGLLVRDTEPDKNGETGRGLEALQAVVTLTGAAVLHNRDAAVLVAGKGGLLSASALLVSDVAAEEHSQRFAIGVIAQEFGRLDLVDSLVRKIAGIGLFFADGTGRVVRSELDDNPVALHTQGSSRIKLGEAPGIPQQWEVLVDEETQLLRNGSRLGSGTLPLPTLHEVVKVHH